MNESEGDIQKTRISTASLSFLEGNAFTHGGKSNFYSGKKRSESSSRVEKTLINDIMTILNVNLIHLFFFTNSMNAM